MQYLTIPASFACRVWHVVIEDLGDECSRLEARLQQLGRREASVSEVVEVLDNVRSGVDLLTIMAADPAVQRCLE